ncbi:hypothetical protein A0H81_06798 [Grifola frondosa]|uniref:Uncharacterized protein n=1 Tax=Grifola frondosa TaxID=5627 RepID=A0A1C7M9E0_GRIFR|nr:hypothetical protein A0H81_06798 [Grifola frondosa]
MTYFWTYSKAATGNCVLTEKKEQRFSFFVQPGQYSFNLHCSAKSAGLTSFPYYHRTVLDGRLHCRCSFFVLQ